MRNIQIVLSIASLCILIACVTTDPHRGTRANLPSRTETYTNAPSQFRFPLRIGEFEREQVKQYDQQGQDVGVGYNHLGLGVAVTVFAYPIPSRSPDNTLDGHFSTCKAQVLRGHSGAQLVSAEAAQFSPGGVQRSGQHAAFTYTEIFAHRRQAVHSELFLFTHGQRFIKYRATYPVGQQAAAEPAIRAFIEELAWP
jgi:hypothetical protein